MIRHRLSRFLTLICALFLLASANLARAQVLNYQDLWWAGSQENGWGMSISQQGSVLFSVMYIYDNSGRAQWVVMPGGTWNSNNTTYSGPLYIPTGSSFATYDATKFVAGASVGNASINFTGTSTATLNYTINGVSGTKAITRQIFGNGAAFGNYSDLWWGGANQNGWGISLTQQGSALFAVWYTYDAQGRATWYVMSGGSFTASNVYSGLLYRTSGPTWLGASYDPNRLAVANVGSLTFTFADSNNATMRATVDGTTVTAAITRQQFGNVIASTPSSFAKLQEKVIKPQCLSCHTAGHPYATQSGLVLDAPVAYRNLINGAVKFSGAVAHGINKQVTPRGLNNSFFYQKLLLWDPQQPQHFGGAMPLGSTSLSIGQIEFIKRWIEAGAPETGEVADAKLLDDAVLPSFAPFSPLPVPAPGQGFQIKVEPFDVAPNFEREFFVYRNIGNTQPIFVSRFETRMRSNSHHLLLYDFQSNTPSTIIPPLDVVRDIRNPDGSMNIFNMFPMSYHVYLAGSMTPTGGYTFPPGVALRLPANARLDFNLHYVNKTNAPLQGEAYANLYTIDAAQVQQVAQTLNLPNTSLRLPPMQRTVQTKDFTFNRVTRILMLTSHTHKMGERFVIQIKGGPRNGEVVYENTDWEHPKIVTFDTPIVLQPGEGLTSIITYFNNTSTLVQFGLTSEDEMGIIFGYSY